MKQHAIVERTRGVDDAAERRALDFDALNQLCDRLAVRDVGIDDNDARAAILDRCDGPQRFRGRLAATHQNEMPRAALDQPSGHAQADSGEPARDEI